MNIEMTEVPQQLFEPGMIVNITCQTDSANPPSVIVWTIDSQIITSGPEYMIITHEQKSSFNANLTISQLSFVARFHHSKHVFECSILGQSRLKQHVSFCVIGK